MRMAVILFFLPTVALLAMPVAHSADDEDARLTAFFKQYLEEEFRLAPMEATRLGDHRFDDRLDDLSPKAREVRLEHERKTLETLPRKIEYAKLTRSGQIDFEILRHHLERVIWLAANTRPFEEDPRAYNDYISDSIYLP